MNKNYLLASKTGAGKSWNITSLINSLVQNQDIKVLLSVHDSKIAKEYSDRFEEAGIDSFVMASHESTFGHQKTPPKEVTLSDIDCPYYDEIQYEIKLGVTSQTFKEEYCANCPLFEQCRFVKQYSEVMEDVYRVVIIQHAHFSASEALFKLLKKKFKLLVIDETFIDSIFDYIPIEQRELEILELQGQEWSYRLFDWLTCRTRAIGKLEPTREELEQLHEDFKTFECTWRIPDLIRYYNQHRIVNQVSGIEVVHELPNIPMRIFADATPPVKLIKELTGIDNLQIVGDTDIIDIKSLHPDNKRYQILDASSSVTKMKDDTYFFSLIEKACQIVKARYINKRTLFTVYSSDKERLTEFITTYHPEILPFIEIGLMNKGTNKWAHFDCQFIFAGRYRQHKEYVIEAYKYKAVSNYYRRKRGEQELLNIYPSDLGEGFSFDYDAMERIPVKINHRNEDGELITRQYDELFYLKPKVEVDSPFDDYWWYDLIFQMDVNEMEQVERIRFNTETAKESFHFHDRYMKDLEITDPLHTVEFLNLVV